MDNISGVCHELARWLQEVGEDNRCALVFTASELASLHLALTLVQELEERVGILPPGFPAPFAEARRKVEMVLSAGGYGGDPRYPQHAVPGGVGIL